MEQEINDRFLELLRSNISTEVGETMVSKMLHTLDQREAREILDFAEQMLRYPEFVCEHEAMALVKEFVNHDGTTGPHWKDAATMFDVVDKMGITIDFPGHYNKWAWYVTMNMLWSDEWGVLKLYVDPEYEVKIMAELTEAKLLDKDKTFRIREYFGL